MPQGQAVDLRERQFVVRLKDYFDQERRQGPSVSTQDAVGRVAQALGLGKRTVKEIPRTYRQTGTVATATLESKGKPPYRIQPALETVIRQRIRALNRQGSHVSVRSLAHWLSENYEEVPRATLGRTLQRMGLVYGKSRNKSALRERDEVVIARRVYLRTKRANRDAHGGPVRPEVYLDESYVNVNHSTPRTWYFAAEGPWVHKPSGKGPRLIIVHAMTTAGWVAVGTSSPTCSVALRLSSTISEASPVRRTPESRRLAGRRASAMRRSVERCLAARRATAGGGAAP